MVYPFISWKTSWLLPNFCNHGQSCYEHSCAGFWGQVFNSFGSWKHGFLTTTELPWKSMAHSKIERKVQRFCIYPLPLYWHYLPDINTHPPPTHLATQWCICYNWWTYIERSWSLKVHRFLYGSLLVYILQFGQMYNDMKCIHNYTVKQSIPTASKSSVLYIFILPFPQLLTTTDLFTVSTGLPFPECHIIKSIQHVVSHCPLSLCNMHLNFLFVFPDLMAHFFLA